MREEEGEWIEAARQALVLGALGLCSLLLTGVILVSPVAGICCSVATFSAAWWWGIAYYPAVAFVARQRGRHVCARRYSAPPLDDDDVEVAA